MSIKDFYNITINAKQSLMSQRCTTFNFFLILSALLLNAVILCIREKIILITLILSTALVLFAFLFYLLEKRNTIYYANLNDRIREYESKLKAANKELEDLDLPFSSEAKLFSNKKHKKTIGYSKFFSYVYGIFILTGFVFIIIATLMLFKVNLIQ